MNVFLDTNVLLSASWPGRSHHKAALRVLDDWPNAEDAFTLCVSPQVIREYLAVATRPRAVNGFGLSLQAALANCDAVCARSTVLPETLPVYQRLRRLLEQVPASGRQVHDANIVATMLAHGIEQLVTANVGDFRRYEPHITVMDLAGL